MAREVLEIITGQQRVGKTARLIKEREWATEYRNGKEIINAEFRMN